MERHALRARLLGPFEIAVDGYPVSRDAFERPSGLRLLKLLLVTPGHALRREEAAELLWPEADPARSAANLRKAVHFCRRALGRETRRRGEAIVAGVGDMLRIDLAVDLDVDLDRLMVALAHLPRRTRGPTPAVRGASEADVVTLDSLRVLADLGGRDLLPEDPYEEWLAPHRERLRQRLGDALVRGATEARRTGERDLAFGIVEAALALDPAEEAAHRIAIELYLDAGQVHAARRQLEACRRAVAEAFGAEPSADLEGLVAATTQRPAALATREPTEASIVGRRRELEAAEAAFDQVAAGSSAAVVLRGAAGIGKSRVLRELSRLADAAAWRVVTARGLERTPETAFAQLGHGLLGAFGGTIPADLPEPARSGLLTVVPQQGMEPALTFGSDAALVAALQDAIAALLRDRPLMIAVDDLQWLDRPSQHLLVQACAALPARPLLLAVTQRDEPGANRGSPADELLESGASEIPLQPLGEREIGVILSRDGGGEPIAADAVTRITELSGGAPLYALEILRTARDRGILERKSGHWQLRHPAQLEQLTTGLSRLVDRRVGALEPSDREMLATAAELGDVVRFEELLAAVDRPTDVVLGTLDEAMTAGILEEAVGGYRFTHPLFRSSLRQSLPPRQRGALHRRVAQVLGGRIDPTDVRAVNAAASVGVDVVGVAAHASQAAELGESSVLQQAVGFGLVAGHRLSRLFDDRDVVDVLRRAIRLWHRLPPDAQSDFTVSAGHIELGQALRRLGMDRDAADAFGASIATARDEVELARAYSAAAQLPYEHGRFTESERILTEGLNRVTDTVAVATLKSSLGWVLARMRRYGEAEPLLLDSIALLERERATPALMRGLDRLAVALPSVSPVDSIRLLERALLIAAEIGEVREETTLRMHLAGSLREDGQLERAGAEVARAIEIARMTGERYLESVSEWISAEIDHAAGRLEDAKAHRRRELAIFSEIGGNSRHEALAHVHLCRLEVLSGNEAAADSEAEAARLIARHSGDAGLLSTVEWRLNNDWFASPPIAEGNAVGTRQAHPRGRA